MNPSKQQLLDSIQPGMRLTKGFFKKVYGYEITDPSFPDKAIAALEVAGCSKARQYYKEWIEEYEMARDAELKSALGRCLRGDEERRKIELLQKKKQLLMQKLQR